VSKAAEPPGNRPKVQNLREVKLDLTDSADWGRILASSLIPRSEERMTLSKVTRHGQVTIPAALRRQVGIEEGDLVEMRAENDHIVLVPKKLIDKSQAYFWTKEWQEAERQARADIEEGRTKEFASVDELLADLDTE